VAESIKRPASSRVGIASFSLGIVALISIYGAPMVAGGAYLAGAVPEKAGLAVLELSVYGPLVLAASGLILGVLALALKPRSQVYPVVGAAASALAIAVGLRYVLF
jgi:hypothetical protein